LISLICHPKLELDTQALEHKAVSRPERQVIADALMVTFPMVMLHEFVDPLRSRRSMHGIIRLRHSSLIEPANRSACAHLVRGTACAPRDSPPRGGNVDGPTPLAVTITSQYASTDQNSVIRDCRHAGDLTHQDLIRVPRRAQIVDAPRGKVYAEQRVVRHQATPCPNLSREEVRPDHGSPMSPAGTFATRWGAPEPAETPCSFRFTAIVERATRCPRFFSAPRIRVLGESSARSTVRDVLHGDQRDVSASLTLHSQSALRLATRSQVRRNAPSTLVTDQ